VLTDTLSFHIQLQKKRDLLGEDDAYGTVYLSLSDDDKIDGMCHGNVLETGPNFGSAGGATLSMVGTLATIVYVGKY